MNALGHLELALEVSEKYGVPAILLLSIGMHESADYTRMPYESNNPFGMKYIAKRHSRKVEATTPEGREMIRQKAFFAGYDTIRDAFFDLGWLFQANSGYSGPIREWLEGPQSWVDWLQMLNSIGPKYAEDVHWGQKVNGRTREIWNAFQTGGA